jgi:hypothetical protein
MSKSLIFSALLSGMALVYGGGAIAAADATPSQVYEAARSGRLGEAEQMIGQVLKDHPQSGEAHYVAAEVYARAGNYARARSELATADQLEPGLPFAKPASVSALRGELSATRVPQALTPVERARERGGLPWGGILLVLLGIGVVWMLIRRRVQASSYSGYPGQPGQPGFSGPAPGMGGGPMYPGPGYGGGGSGLMGSLGTGLAIGAGVAAGEELVHHVLDGHQTGGVISNASADELGNAPPQNGDMGGQDFGVNDSSSWDDSSGNDGGSFDSGGGGDGWN